MWKVSWFLAAAACLVAACEPPPETEPAVYVGAVDDAEGKVAIGLAVQDGLAALFACAGDPAEYPGWFVGDVAADGTTRSQRGRWTAIASWSAAGADGALIEPDGSRLDWSAAPVAAGGGDDAAGAVAGLYAAVDSGCTTGVVVVDDPATSAPLVRGAWCSGDGERAQVTPLFPLRLVGGQLAVEVSIDGGTRRLDVRPVRLPIDGWP